jgi:hypothetical protein
MVTATVVAGRNELMVAIAALLILFLGLGLFVHKYTIVTRLLLITVIIGTLLFLYLTYKIPQNLFLPQ